MAMDNSEETPNDISYFDNPEEDKSFVKKVRSRVSGLLNTSISRLFGTYEEKKPIIRRREEDDDDDAFTAQPPCKRAKIPTDGNSIHNIFKVNDNHVSQNMGFNVSSGSRSKYTHFPEPVAGPSGIKSHKTLSERFSYQTTMAQSQYGDDINGDKGSDSGESTSGYSSLVKNLNRDKIVQQSESEVKKTPPLENTSLNSRKLFNTTQGLSNRSLFAENMLSPQGNSSLSSRRPSFNASTFGSPNFVDRTISTNRIMNSPFYSGRTAYGGASAYGRHLGNNPATLRNAARNTFSIKPLNKPPSSSTALSKTAKRILDTLEQYSTPISDARKIPLPTKTKRTTEGLLTKYTGANPYMVRESKTASNRELMVPTVPELLQMKQKQHLQDTTEAVRKIATNSKSTLNKEEYKLRSTNDSKQKHSNKMKSKVASVRAKAPTIEVHENLVLNPVSLPITTLPKFDLIIPPPDSIKEQSKQKDAHPSEIKSNSISRIGCTKNVPENGTGKSPECLKVGEFKFSNPLIIADNLKSIVAINNFKFSEPVLQDACNNRKLNFKMPENKHNYELSIKKKNNGEMNIVKPVPPQLVEGSVLDVLGKKSEPTLLDMFKPPEGTWECAVCLIRNPSKAVRCEACEILRVTEPPKAKENLINFGLQFNKKSDEWDCNGCMVRNKIADNVCVACSASKPMIVNSANTSKSNDKWQCNKCSNWNKIQSTKCTSCESSAVAAKPSFQFVNPFKPPVDSWECDSCLVRNRADLEQCEACRSTRPNKKVTDTGGGFGSKFKPASDTWECDSCLVRNNKKDDSCVACGSLRSGAVAKPLPGSFKKTSSEWECTSCMVRNSNKLEKCQCCESPKPGVTIVSKDSVNMFNFGVNKSKIPFKFGVPDEKKETAPSGSVSAGSIFGETAKPATVDSGTFSFGIKTAGAALTSNKPFEPSIIAAAPVVSNLLPKPVVNQTNAQVEFKFGSDSFTSSPSAALKKPEQTQESKNGETPNPMQTFINNPFPTNGDVKKTTDVFNTSLTTASSLPWPIDKPPAIEVAPPTKLLFKFEASKPLPLAKDNNVVTTNNIGTRSIHPLPVNATLTAFADSAKANNPETTFEAMKGGKKLFAFGGDEPGSKKPAFSFGASPVPTTNTPKQQQAVFGFGSSGTPSGGFNFTANSTTNSAPGGFAFNPTKTEAPAPSFSAAPPPYSFNAAAPAQTTKNGGFNFGMAANNNNQKASFSFGGTQSTSNQNQAAPFNFSAPPVVPSGGFNFTSAAPSVDANGKGTFNFTAGSTGIPSFNAQPTDVAASSTRRIKRAVRRTPR